MQNMEKVQMSVHKAEISNKKYDQMNLYAPKLDKR